MSEGKVYGRYNWLWLVGALAGMMIAGVVIDIYDIDNRLHATLLILAPTVLLFPMVRNALAKAAQRGTTATPARRYIWRMLAASVVYLSSLFLASYVIEVANPPTSVAVALAIVPGIAVVGYIWAIGRLIVELEDEFLKMLAIRQALIATAIALSLASVWGFLEKFELVAHVDAFWWPTIWFFGLGIGAVSNKIKYGVFGEIR